MKKIIFSLLLLNLFVRVNYSQCTGVTIDLNTWSVIGSSSDWQIDPSGNSVYQAFNGSNTFLVSPQDFINVKFKGTFRIGNDGDDDFVGFVLGHKDSGGGNYEYNLFSKKGAYINSTARCHNYYGAFSGTTFSNTQQTAVLPSVMTDYVCNNTFPDWVYDTDYNFECIYTTTNTTIKINGTTVVDVDGCFEPGHFGFYNSSQSKVTYSNFQYESALDYDFVTNDSVCLGASINPDIFCVTSTNPYTNIRWEMGDGTTYNNSLASISHTYSSGGTYNIELLAIDGFGCADSITRQVVVFDPQFSLGSDIDTCSDSPITIMPDNTVGTDTYNWSTTETTSSINISNSGSYNLTLTDMIGCVAKDTIIITITPYPTAQFTVLSTCANVPVSFSEASTSSGTLTNWEWDYGDGIGTSTNQDDNYTFLAGGAYDVELIVTDDHGCKDTLKQSIAIYNQPQAQFTFTSAGCFHDTVYFTDASTINSPDNIASWSWDVENDEVIDYTTQDSKHLYISSGDFDVTLNVVSNNGCQHSVTQTVTVGALPNVGFSASTVCVNADPTMFVNTSTIAAGSNALFGWSFGDGGVSTDENPTHDYSIAASYPVTLRVVSDLGCVDSVTYSVDVFGKPTADFAQDAIAECAPMCVNFINQSFDDIEINHWSWKFENNFGESFSKNPNHCFLNDGTYDISLIIRNVQGCKDTVEKVGLITAFPQPTSDFTFSPESTDVLSPEIEFTNNSVDAVAWEWNFNDGTENNLVDYDPVHSFGDTAHFEVALIVYNNTLCSDTSYHIVEILPVDEVFVPSAFSPNGDGKNDVLYARGYIGEMYFAVYDRLGKKVFESTNKENGWDGLINGKKALAGVYSWYLQAVVNEKEYKLKGDITLVR